MGGRVGQEEGSGNREGQLCKMIKDYIKKDLNKKRKRITNCVGEQYRNQMLLGRARLGTHTVLENVHKSILGVGEDLGDQEEGKGECWGNLGFSTTDVWSIY